MELDTVQYTQMLKTRAVERLPLTIISNLSKLILIICYLDTVLEVNI